MEHESNEAASAEAGRAGRHLARVRLASGVLSVLALAWHAAEVWRAREGLVPFVLGLSGARGGPLVVAAEALLGVLPPLVYLGATLWQARRRAGEEGGAPRAEVASAVLLGGLLLWHLSVAWLPKIGGAGPWERVGALADLGSRPLGFALGALLLAALAWHLEAVARRLLPARAGLGLALGVLLALACWPMLQGWSALATGAVADDAAQGRSPAEAEQVGGQERGGP